MDIPEKRIRIEDLPDNLCNVAKKQYGSGAGTLEGIITYIRHYMSNYDALRKKMRMDNDEMDRFRDVVNYLIERALIAWHRRRRKQGYKGLWSFPDAHWLLDNEYKNTGLPSYKRNTERRAREAVTDKVNQG